MKEDIVYQTSPNYVAREIAGETILIPVGEAALQFNGMATLNETGKFLWNLLKEGATVRSLTDALAAEYELTEEQSQSDVSEFMELLSSRSVIVEK